MLCAPKKECGLCAYAAGFLRPESRRLLPAAPPRQQLRDHEEGTAAAAAAATTASHHGGKAREGCGFWLRVSHLEGGLPLSGQAGWLYLRLQQALLAGQHRPPRSSWQGEAQPVPHIYCPRSTVPQVLVQLCRTHTPPPKVSRLRILLLPLCTFLGHLPPTLGS